MRKPKFKPLLPFAEHISSKCIGDEIKSFDPSNPEHIKEWEKIQKNLFDIIKADFDTKGIPMPTISIDTTPSPITYGIKTIDESGNIIRTLLKPKDESNK